MALVGVLVEMVLLRRIYHAPELFQLLATFGLTLMVQDIVVLIWGPDDLLGRRAPGFKGAVDFFGQNIPSYDLFLIALSPIVLGGLWLLFQRTRWGVLVRAATQDRDMVAALGVNQKWLFTSVFALGVFLAALGGALQIPRDAVHHALDLRIIVEVFVVVVIGGLGSIIGAFVAAVLVSMLAHVAAHRYGFEDFEIRTQALRPAIRGVDLPGVEPLWSLAHTARALAHANDVELEGACEASYASFQ